MGIKSHTFDPNASLSTTNGGGEKKMRVELTAAEKKRIEVLIRNAKSLAEIARLEKELNEGRIPPGAAGDDDAMEE
jgi:U2 small nuclear ribonucleoprotein A'